MKVLKLICLAIAPLILQLRSDAAFADQDCMASYYRTKSPACVEQVLAQLQQIPASHRTDPNTIIGFLAEIFRDAPEERQRILNAETSDYTRSVVLVSLYRAGLPDDAHRFAETNNLSALSGKLEAGHVTPLDELKPSSNPGIMTS